jgi:hypothetical protein
VDPIGFTPGDPNLYRYGFNNPANNTDPTGKSAETNISRPRPPIDELQRPPWPIGAGGIADILNKLDEMRKDIKNILFILGKVEVELKIALGTIENYLEDKNLVKRYLAGLLLPIAKQGLAEIKPAQDACKDLLTRIDLTQRLINANWWKPAKPGTLNVEILFDVFNKTYEKLINRVRERLVKVLYSVNIIWVLMPILSR